MVKNIDQALPQNPFTIGDKFVETVPLNKLPPATIGDITIKDNQVRFKLFRGNEEYLSMSTIDPKTKKATYTQLVGVNWYDFNKAKQTFVNPSPNTIKNLMLIPDKWEGKFPRFNRYTDNNTGVWKIAQNEPEKMEALTIKYLNDEKYVTGYVPNAKNLDLMGSDKNIGSIKDKDGNIEEFFVVKDGNQDISNLVSFNLQKIEVATLKAEIKDMKSGSYKYLNNLYAPFKSKVKDSVEGIFVRNARQKKADKITAHLKSVEAKDTQLTLLETSLPINQKRADRSIIKLWGADVERMFVERQTAQATSGINDIASDPIFFNLPKSITQSERLEIAKVTARLRYQDVAQDNFVNIARVLSAKEIDAINNISKLQLFASRNVESIVAGERNSSAFGKSVTEYIQAKKILTEATETVTTNVGLTDNFKLLEFKNTVPKLDKNGKPTYVTNRQVLEAEENVRKSLLNIQGNESSYQFGTTGMSSQIRESVDMRGKTMEWTNPQMSVDEQMELNTKAQFENVQRKKELVEELSIVDFKLASVTNNIEIQKTFEVVPDDFISTKIEPVTAEELAIRSKFYRLSKDYLQYKYDNTKPTVDKLDQDFGKPTTPVGQEGIKGGIPDIAKIIPSSKDDVLRTKDDLDLGFKSDIQNMDDLMDMARNDAITNPQSGKLIDEMEKILWKQSKVEPTIGTGIDGIVSTGRKEHGDIIDQMRRIDEQKSALRDYNKHRSMMKQNKKWLDRRFDDEEAVNKALRLHEAQTVIKSDGSFVIGQGIGNNPINSQSSMWKNRIETPENDYLKLIVKRENINQKLDVVDYQITSQNKRILEEGHWDKTEGDKFSILNEWVPSKGLTPELENKKSQVISAIIKSEEDKMLREATQFDDYLVAPKKSNKQVEHLDYTRRQALANDIGLSGGEANVNHLKQLYKYKVPKEGGNNLDVEALDTLLLNYDKIKKARTLELSTPVEIAVFAKKAPAHTSFVSMPKENVKYIPLLDKNKEPMLDTLTGKNMYQKVITPIVDKEGNPVMMTKKVTYTGVSQNVQLPREVPMFMKYDYGNPNLPRVLGDNQERRVEIINSGKGQKPAEVRVTFFDKKPITTKSGLNIGYNYQLVPDKRKAKLTTESDISEGYVQSVDYRYERKVYIQKLDELNLQLDTVKTLKSDSVDLKLKGDELTQAIDDTPVELKIRFGNLDQIAPDKRKLQELDRLRQVTEFEKTTLKSDIENIDSGLEKLAIEKQNIKEPTNVPVDSITPLGGQFAISSSRMTDEQARQLSFVLPQIGTSKNFRVIENLIDNNDYFKGQVWFENVYYDKAGTDLGVTGSHTFKIPEQQQAWDKIKLVEQKYDRQVGASYVTSGVDSTPRQTDQVIQEIENMIRISDPPKNPMVSMVDNSRTNPSLGSQAQYGYEVDGAINKLDKTDPKLVASYEKDFLNQLKDKYKLHGKLIENSDKLNKKKNELTDTLSKLESTKQQIHSSNPYELKSFNQGSITDKLRGYQNKIKYRDTITSTIGDITTTRTVKDGRTVNQGYLDSLDTASTPSTPSSWNPRIIQNKISIGIQKRKLEGQISHTNNQIKSIDGKLSNNQSKLDEVRTSRLDSFQVNENIKSDHLILEDNTRWMHFDENISGMRGKSPDEQGMPKPDLDNNDPADVTLLPTFNQEHTRLLTPVKIVEGKKKTEGVSSYRSLQRILDNNAVSTAYGQQPIPVLPFAIVRYPEGTPQDIQDNVGIMEMPQPLDFAQRPQSKSFTEPFNNSPMNPPISSFDTSPKAVLTSRSDLGNMFRTSSDFKLGTINASRLLTGKPVIVAQTPVVTPTTRQGNITKLYPIEAIKPLSMSGVVVAPKPIIQQKAPIPLPVWAPPLPYAKRPKKKKEKPKKVKKRKIYWDVSSSPFEPFNPKEYYTFKNEPRSVKFKEKRKNFDGNLPR